MLRKPYWTLLATILILALHAGCSSGGPETESEAFAEMEAAEADFLEGGDAFADGGSWDDFEDGGDLADDFGGNWDDFEDGGDLSAEVSDDNWADEFGDDFADDFAAEGESVAQAEPAPLDDFGSEFSDEDFGDEFADEFAFGAEETAPPTETADLVAPAPPAGDEFAMYDSGGFEDPFEGIDSMETPVDPLLPEESSYDISSYGSGDINSQLGLVPVKKIKTDPYWRNGRLLNAVYIGRPGDTVSSISWKVFGADRSSQIIADNPWLGKGITVGEKLYYNSPNRPDDNTMILTYYEDSGVPFETYTTQPGDNIRAVSTRLLGFDGAWKEIWATNPEVTSKEVVTAGLQLRYWPSSGAAPIPIASNTPRQTPAHSAPAVMGDPQMSMPSMPVDTLESSPEPVPAQQQAAHTGASEMSSVGVEPAFEEPIEMMDPPPLDPIAEAPPVEIPEPEMAAVPPPPPPPAPADRVAHKTSVGGGTDNSTIRYALFGLLLIFIAILIARVVKRRRAPSLEYTQV